MRMIAMNINTNDNACSEVESLQSVVYLWSLSLARVWRQLFILQFRSVSFSHLIVVWHIAVRWNLHIALIKWHGKCVNNFFVLHFRYDLFSLAKDIVLVSHSVVLQLNACSMFGNTKVNCKNRTVRTAIFPLSFFFFSVLFRMLVMRAYIIPV